MKRIRFRKSEFFLPCLLFFFFANSKISYSQYEDSPCYYCHLDICIELIKSVHGKAKVSCQSCHGESIEHMMVEDNSVKPDSNVSVNHVDIICAQCHDDVQAAYRQGKHAQFLFEKNIRQPKLQTGFPSCVTCHTAHSTPTDFVLEKTCISCHVKLPQHCQSSEKDKKDNSLISCKLCHISHSLKIEKIKQELKDEKN